MGGTESTSLEGTFSENENCCRLGKSSGIYFTHCTASFVVKKGSEIKDIKILKCYIQGGIAIKIT